MRRWFILILTVFAMCIPVKAQKYEAPPAPKSVEHIVPEEADSFAQGLWNVVRACIGEFHPALAQGAGVCLKVLASALLCGMITNFSGKETAGVIRLAGVAAVGTTLLRPSSALMDLGVETVRSLSSYGKLLIPVMTGALAAQGGGGTAAALYAATAFFDSVLSSAVSSLMIPMLYLFLGLSIGYAAVQEPVLGKIKDLIKWLIQWILKIALYLFTGFLTVTGVVSGNADAAALKAAKIAISGAVPVVGGILSDASEAVLVGAGVMRSAIGVYGLITIVALFLSPFVKMGTQYLLMKITGGICASFVKGGASILVQDFCTAMGLILALTATQTVLLLISTVCMMKGVS